MHKQLFSMLVSVAALGFCAGAVSADTGRFGDWVVVPATDGSGDTIAGTFADGNSKYLGVRCFAATSQCLHVLVTGSRCVNENSYPLLLNGSTGAASIEGVCSLNGGRHELLLTPFDKVRTAINGTGVIGIAVPMESGAFSAIRFSLTGSTRALEYGEKTLGAPKKAGSATF
ncbi:hypothetical protein GPA27_13105 [Aromatoleum toluolicum]|uniref:Uncharacterized protein n=1 Tax=Aromatoleum toluolicum TaxID=90060 RepID=A0ABX1NG93_9RHOO|nr:hypothetical protein [Aromatoleum toluolicum]NMF98322.1 hypothetical protein [Aromatoleum toluolicum]